MKTIEIASHKIGANHPTFVIAEAGVNHNGSLDMAKRLIDAAADAGADAVKFQSFRPEELVTEEAATCDYQKRALNDNDISQLEMLRKLELSVDDHVALIDYCRQRQIVFLSTPFDSLSAQLLDDLKVPAFKIPSGEVTNPFLLSQLAGMGRPILMSTGMCRLSEVESAVETLEKNGAQEIVLLHCVSNYPADVSEVNLRAIDTLQAAFGFPVGYSDHTLGCEISWAAVARGACVIEKHFTLDRTLPGPDHVASLEPDELSHLVRGIRNVELALGDGRKRPTASELDTARAARKSLVAAHDISAGSRLTASMIAIKRPGTGLAPDMRDQFIDQVAQQDIPAGTLLQRKMVA